MDVKYDNLNAEGDVEIVQRTHQEVESERG